MVENGIRESPPKSLENSGLVIIELGGGFKYFLCSSLFGEDSHSD